MFAPQKPVSPYPVDSINHKDNKDYNKPGFLVRATAKGVYGLGMREAGDVFKIEYARHFADSRDPKLNGLGWMEKVDGPVPQRRRSGSAEPRGARTAPEDPSDRDTRMARVDKLEKEAREEDLANAEAEADVI